MLESFGRDDFRIIATFADSQDDGKVIANKESGIATVADLPGKKIGVRERDIGPFCPRNPSGRARPCPLAGGKWSTSHPLTCPLR